MKKLVLTVFVWVQGTVGYGNEEALINLAGTKMWRYHKQQGSDRESLGHDYTFFTAKVCYQLDQICIGARIFSGDHEIEVKDDEKSQVTKTSIRYVGTAIYAGYLFDSVIVDASYYSSCQMERRVESMTENNRFSTMNRYDAFLAYSVDVGYRFPVGGIHFGPMISFSHFAFRQDQGQSADEQVKDEMIEQWFVPYASMWVEF